MTDPVEVIARLLLGRVNAPEAAIYAAARDSLQALDAAGYAVVPKGAKSLRATTLIYSRPTRDEIIRWADSALRNVPDGCVTQQFMEDLMADFADGIHALAAAQGGSDG